MGCGLDVLVGICIAGSPLSRSSRKSSSQVQLGAGGAVGAVDVSSTFLLPKIPVLKKLMVSMAQLERLRRCSR